MSVGRGMVSVVWLWLWLQEKEEEEANKKKSSWQKHFNKVSQSVSEAYRWDRGQKPTLLSVCCLL